MVAVVVAVAVAVVVAVAVTGSEDPSGAVVIAAGEPCLDKVGFTARCGSLIQK